MQKTEKLANSQKGSNFRSMKSRNDYLYYFVIYLPKHLQIQNNIHNFVALRKQLNKNINK